MREGRELQIPRHHGEVLCLPELGRWREVAEASARSLDRRHLLGQPLAVLREEARRQLVACSHELLSRWDLPAPEPSPGPWVATGHQPTFFHPGIWVKTWSLNVWCARGGVGLNVVVDSDEARRYVARIPRRDGALQVVERVLASCGPGVPLEAAPPPTEDAWRGLCTQLAQDLATLGAPELVDRVARLESAGLESLRRARHLGEFGASLRRRLEWSCGAVGYLEVTVSQLARTPAFRRFAAWIVQDAERFWVSCNQALEVHRREEGLRSAAQPFPNLQREGDLVELPFWLLRDGRRRPVWAQTGTEDPVLVCDGVTVGAASQLPWELRPRALTLTLFVRLLICDLFVHGLGGARYDRVTDRVMHEFFGTPPPPYAVLTATFQLPLARHADPQARYAAAYQRWLDLQHNPDRYLPREGEVADLVAEKWRCIQALTAEDLPRGKRRELTRRIRAINDTLRKHLQNRIHQVWAELEDLRRELEQYRVATDRCYPFFLFDPDEVRAPLEATEGVRCSR